MQLSEHFSANEFACGCGCGLGTRPGDVSEKLLSLLENMRVRIGEPIVITSGRRCWPHNSAIGGYYRSPHPDGEAADILCKSGEHRYRLLKAAVLSGATGIGNGANFIHVDVSTKLDRPRSWLYS